MNKQIFLDAENFGGDSKFIKTFMEVAEDEIIEYRDKTGTIHNHTLLFQEIPSCGDSGYTFDACKRLAEEHVQVVIDSLHAMAKIPMESLDFEDIWERWMSVKDRRFQE
jgi:hypothetical protein